MAAAAASSQGNLVRNQARKRGNSSSPSGPAPAKETAARHGPVGRFARRQGVPDGAGGYPHQRLGERQVGFRRAVLFGARKRVHRTAFDQLSLGYAIACLAVRNAPWREGSGPPGFQAEITALLRQG